VALIFVRGGRTKNGTILGSEKPGIGEALRQLRCASAEVTQLFLDLQVGINPFRNLLV
jgi:hypothetical protein